MSKFEFSADMSPQENLETFFTYLDSVDKEMSKLLRQKFYSLLPLPDPGPRRNAKRQSFNTEIAQALDAETQPEEKL